MRSVILFFLACFAGTLSAQEIVLSTGGNAFGNSGTVVYSVGQVAFHTLAGEGYILNEGVQQPYEILIPIGIDDQTDLLPGCKVKPNPAEDQIFLTIKDYPLQNLEYTLISCVGVQLIEEKIIDVNTIINIENFSSGVYFLSIVENDKLLKNLKIIKR